MESNNNNIEMILNSLDMTNENVLQVEILTPNLDNSNSTINNIENYINEKYDQIAISNLKNQIISEIKDIFKNQLTNGSQVNDLQKHNAFLLNEVYFLREEVREKNYLIRTLNQRIIKPENRCECRLNNNKEQKLAEAPPDVTSSTLDPDLSLILAENQNVDTVSTRTKHVNENPIYGDDKDKNEKEGDTGKQDEETKKKTEKKSFLMLMKLRKKRIKEIS